MAGDDAGKREVWSRRQGPSARTLADVKHELRQLSHDWPRTRWAFLRFDVAQLGWRAWGVSPALSLSTSPQRLQLLKEAPRRSCTLHLSHPMHTLYMVRR
jgi:hypothetical protein